MSDHAQKQQELVSRIKDLAAEIGRIPTPYEFSEKFPDLRRTLLFMFHNYNALLAAADLDDDALKIQIAKENAAKEKLTRKFNQLCSRKEQIQGFFRHVIDLKDLFARAGNPPSLKVSAQPDTHVKFKDVPAVNCYKKFLRYYRPDVHIIMGDFIDCEGVSHWPSQRLEPRRLIPEIIEARTLLKELVDATPDCSTRIYICGNHEAWVKMALAKMPELFDGLELLDLDVTIEKLLSLDKFKYNFFPLNHLVQIGRAHFTHGIYTTGAHAKKHLDVFKTNIFYGHMHDTQQFNQTSVDGAMDAQSLGCLCRLDADFLKGRPNNWTHAHGVFEFFPDGTFTYFVPKIINGLMSFNGVVFNGNEP